jgi:hypothetical protein
MVDNEIRILSIIPYKIFPAKLGGEKGIAVFNEYLAQQVSLTGVTTKNNDPVYAKGYKLLNILSNSKLRYVNIFLYFTIRRLIKQERSTHLLIEHPYYGWLAWLIRKTTNIRWVVHSHNIEFMRSRSIGRWWWKALKWYEGWVYRKGDNIFFISEDDMNYAIKNMNADVNKSQPVTYGIEIEKLPDDIAICRQTIQEKHSINAENKILLFNGALYHSTNYDALRIILDEVNLYLLNQQNFKYTILVCGRGLPDFFNELKDYSGKNVIYAGFVDDISIYFKAADIFLNPILSGGGVKTKAIEALAMNCTVISTELGAMGIKKEVCGNKLMLVKEGEWKKFGDLIISCSSENFHTPREFFDYYYWGNIIRKVVDRL